MISLALKIHYNNEVNKQFIHKYSHIGLTTYMGLKKITTAMTALYEKLAFSEGKFLRVISREFVS